MLLCFLFLPQLCNNLQFRPDAHWELLQHNSRLNSRRQGVLRTWKWSNRRQFSTPTDSFSLPANNDAISISKQDYERMGPGWLSLEKMIAQWKRERMENECCSSFCFFHPSYTPSNSLDGYDYFFSVRRSWKLILKILFARFRWNRIINYKFLHRKFLFHLFSSFEENSSLFKWQRPHFYNIIRVFISVQSFS